MWLTCHPATYEMLAEMREQALNRKAANKARIAAALREPRTRRALQAVPGVVALAPRGLRRLARG